MRWLLCPNRQENCSIEPMLSVQGGKEALCAGFFAQIDRKIAA